MAEPTHELVTRDGEPRPPTPPPAITAAKRRVLLEGRERKKRRTMTLVQALTGAGHTAAHIAEILGLKTTTVYGIQYKLRKMGHCQDTVDRITHLAVPMAVDGLIGALENRERWAIEKTLTGRGVLATGAAAAKGGMVTGPPPALGVAISFVGMDPNDPRLKAITANVIGAPMPPPIEGQVVTEPDDVIDEAKAKLPR